MAEAQEQPQVRPQPEPASAAAEERTHTLPPLLPPLRDQRQQQPQQLLPPPPTPNIKPELASLLLSPACQTREKSREAQSWAPTPPEADTNASQQQEHIREPAYPPSDAVPESEIATTSAPERESEQGKGQEDRGHELQQDQVSNVSISAPTSEPLTSPSVSVTAATTVATEQHQESTPHTKPTDPDTPPRDQQKTSNEGKERDGAVSPSRETMSHNLPQGHGTPRQPLHYPTPSTYATGGISNAHYGYQSTAPQTQDLYRATALTPANNAMPLPSMRTFDPAQQQSQQQQHMAAVAMPVSPGPSVPAQQPISYYGQQMAISGVAGHPYGSLASDTMGQRYALPPRGPSPVLTGTRHKKEIRRRTKTGCLTCRKRRIKCDEQHPTCKNCQKSKRECLGYDPIFKNQQQSPQQSHQSQPTQPAQVYQQHQPSHQPPHQQPHHAKASLQSTHSSVTPTSASSSSSLPRSGPSASTPLTPSTTSSYTAVPLGLSAATSTQSASAYNSPRLPSGANSFSAIKSEGHPYHPLDSTVNTALTTSSMSTSHFPATIPVTPYLVDYRAKESPHLRGGGSFVPMLMNSSHTPHSPSLERTPAYSGISVHKMKVQDLLAVGNSVPPTLNAPMTQEKVAEVQNLYAQVYAPGLEKFFESEWYLRPSGGPSALASNAKVQEVLAAFLQSLATTSKDDVAGMAYSANLEFRVVWELATLVQYAPEYKVMASNGIPPTDDVGEARNRVMVFDTLLSGGFLDRNPLSAPVGNPGHASHHRNRELKFWYGLGQFLMVRDHPNMDVTPQRDHVLGQLRELLDGRENRDVLYSLTVIRALTHKFPPDFESMLPPHLDESDPKSKLAVARKFVQEEARVTGGTTNVVRRFSELGVRAFITPGYNIAR
ncbi:hypothetical protein F5Y17DRAFT_119664 [Xylariaceae sp. FL0594]|nr:hypothetical protein F5Y17DRAFT_119664 [Xylariaceae sp. FL0594]